MESTLSAWFDRRAKVVSKGELDCIALRREGPATQANFPPQRFENVSA
jgi:hypothetical protein